MQVGFDFQRDERNPGGDASEAVLAALLLRFMERDEPGRVTREPFASLSGYRESATLEVQAKWEELTTLVQAAAVRGRLYDLLWIERAGRSPHEHARAAIRHYISGAELRLCDGIQHALILGRALELAREVDARDQFSTIAEAAGDGLVAEVQRDDAVQRPGVSIRLLRLLIDLPESDRPADLSARIEELHALFAENHPEDREALFQLEEKLARGDPDTITCLRRSNIRLWIDWALEQGSGWFRRLALGMALERANNMPGADDLQSEIRLRMQEIGADDPDLHEVSVDLDIPVAELDEIVDWIVRDDGIPGSLARFGAWGPPTGGPTENAEAAARDMEQFVFWRLVSTTLFDHDGRPIRPVVTEDEKRDHAIRQRETLSAIRHGMAAMWVLDRIGERLSPSHAELADLFETAFIRPHQADAFARAFAHYWAGRFDEAIHIALPRIESALRNLLVASGGIAYTEPHAGRSGRDKPLGAILSELGRTLPSEGWHRSLVVLLTEPTGLNLRNRYMHGQITQAEKLDAALVLHIAAFLRLFLPRTPSTQG